MKCKICGRPAVIKLPAHNIALCEKCFEEFVLRRVKNAIKTYKMFTKDDKVAVAVSGGKDSLALWDILTRLGYETGGIHIHLGIGKYSDESLQKAENFAKKINSELTVIYVRDFFGTGIPEIAKITKRKTCSVCGTIKRYLMNRFAYEKGYTVLATGHNLDDEASTLLGNLLYWKDLYLARKGPVLPSTHPKLIRKVKPLVFLTEREIAAYTILRGIDYIYEECPHAAGATSIFHKHVLNEIENYSPGTKLHFLKGFYERKNIFARLYPEETKMQHECKECGYPSSGEICGFCKLRRRVKEKLENGRETTTA